MENAYFTAVGRVGGIYKTSDDEASDDIHDTLLELLDDTPLDEGLDVSCFGFVVDDKIRTWGIGIGDPDTGELEIVELTVTYPEDLYLPWAIEFFKRIPDANSITLLGDVYINETLLGIEVEPNVGRVMIPRNIPTLH